MVADRTHELPIRISNDLPYCMILRQDWLHFQEALRHTLKQAKGASHETEMVNSNEPLVKQKN